MSEETTFNLEMASEQFEKEYRLGNLKFSDPEPKATVRVRPGVLFINLIFLNPNLRHHNNGCRGDLFGDTAFGAFPQEYLQRLSYAVSQTWG